MRSSLKRTSRFLSLILRHQPESIGLRLDSEGWVDVPVLLAAMKQNGRSISEEELNLVVSQNDKKRFTLRDGRIRANQGHSIPVDLELKPQTPPEHLYHGTADRFLEAILRQGLKPMTRQHVHLSKDQETALSVGRRHGRPVVLVVEAARMVASRHRFYRSENGVWLSDRVPPEFLSRLDRAAILV